jgi:hypothetical protein
LVYDLKEDPPESAMEIVRGSEESLARYGYYLKMLQDDDEFNLNLLECHRIAVMFTLVDRFKTWELEKDKEEWVTFLKNNYSVADLMRKYEEFALKYLQNAKGVSKGPISVFDQAREIVAEFRSGGGELRIEWKGEEVLEGVSHEYKDYQRPEEIRAPRLGGSSNVPQDTVGDEAAPEEPENKKHKRRNTDSTD